ncbi:MAG: Gfo/Idh/MocA family oxidoreductase [Proteobacteria bacterium]|nr:Gfo/Idh/MocA family oxidoreductase [Pseudomonadota bacterium]
MITHPSLPILIATEANSNGLASFISYLRSISHVNLTVASQVPADISAFKVIITTDTCLSAPVAKQLEQFVSAGGGLLHLAGSNAKPLPAFLGAQPGPAGPAAELRVLFENRNHPLAARLPDAIYVSSSHVPLKIADDDVETILYADWHYTHTPVLTRRRIDSGHAACTTIQAFGNPLFQQILYRLLFDLSGMNLFNKTLGVGILGYAPSVGRLHGQGIGATPGLILRAAGDLNPERLHEATKDFPGIHCYESADKLLHDPEVDLVIIATAPNTHARLCLQMMAAGKHVVCEKPLALNSIETAAMVEMADMKQVHLSCHQNRRFDADYLAIKQALAEGLIGELFYMETFVGSYNHPCGYWHSHAGISGGATYDWGGHYLDWIVSLIPKKITHVIGTRHKRVWHDVTNADQERIQLRFAGGQEAEFMHSDIAAVRKPKWYLLGTEGAIIGAWREVTVNELDPVLYYHEQAIPPTEMTPALVLQRRHCSGEIVSQKLAIPKRQDYQFHRNLADHLLFGEPLAAPLADSVRVVAILAAAARSAAQGGTMESLDV